MKICFVNGDYLSINVDCKRNLDFMATAPGSFLKTDTHTPTS